MHIWALGLSCETPAAPVGLTSEPSCRGFTRQPENSKRAHFRAPALQNTTKIPREDPQRDTETAKRWREREEKARNFGPPTPSGPTLLGPTLLGPHPSGPHPSGPHPSGPHPSGPHPSGPHPSGPHPSGPHPSGPHPSGLHPFGAPFWVKH